MLFLSKEIPLRVYQEVLLIVTKIVFSLLDPKHKDEGLLELLRLKMANMLLMYQTL